MTIRSVAYVGALALAAQVLLVCGCGGDNSPSTPGGSGGVIGTGGVTGSGGATVSPTGGTTGPATTGTGGTTTTSPDAGGGTTGTGTFEPSCNNLVTAAGIAPTKNGICTDTDPQLCYKTCGPQSIGFKSETCTAGVYVEQSGCSFLPDGDFSCYKIPTTIDPSCPAETPQASTPCSVAPCTLCNVNDGYLDSSGAAKTGYCVCPPLSATAIDAGSSSKWSCASKTAWPCPAGQGC